VIAMMPEVCLNDRLMPDDDAGSFLLADALLSCPSNENAIRSTNYGVGVLLMNDDDVSS